MKSTLIALTVFAATTSYGQGEILPKELMHDGILRSYRLYVPSSYTLGTPFPLVVNTHGITRDGDQQMLISGMNAIAEQEGFIVAYPDAVNGDWFGGEDNIGFIDALTDTISSEYTIDESRLYATGMSQGAVFSYVLGAARPNRFAAIAAVGSHRPYVDNEDSELFPSDVPFFPNRVFPMLQILGDADPFVPYSGGAGFGGSVWPAIEDVVSDWVIHNGGQEALSFMRLPDLDPNDGTTVDLFSCSDCDTYTGVSGEERVAEVLFYRINDGGHNWPGDYRYPEEESWRYPVNYDISGSTVIWEFFARHELPIPEPASALLLVLAVAAVWLRWRPTA